MIHNYIVLIVRIVHGLYYFDAFLYAFMYMIDFFCYFSDVMSVVAHRKSSSSNAVSNGYPNMLN